MWGWTGNGIPAFSPARLTIFLTVDGVSAVICQDRLWHVMKDDFLSLSDGYNFFEKECERLKERQMEARVGIEPAYTALQAAA
jgi:hypothetical protein